MNEMKEGEVNNTKVNVEEKKIDDHPVPGSKEHEELYRHPITGIMMTRKALEEDLQQEREQK